MSAVSDETTIYQRPVELLQNLIRFDTTNPPGNERECIVYINRLLNTIGIETTILARDPARPNLVARLSGRKDVPPLLLYGHVDVVPTENQTWQYPPFEGRLIDGYVWGRGALDDKGGIAMLLAAFLRAKAEDLALPGDVILAILSDEEHLGEYGAKYLVGSHAKLFEGTRYAIGEFGGFTFYVGRKKFYPIMVAEKQVCGLEACVRGPTGHSALSLHGGAMAKLGNVLTQLNRHKLPAHITTTTRQMFQSMASSLPFPSNMLLRLILKPRLTNLVLKLIGIKGQAFDPLLHNTVNATLVRGGEHIGQIPDEIALHLACPLLPGLSPDDIISELQQFVGDDIEFKVIAYEPVPAEPDMGLFDTLVSILREADPDGVPLPLLLPTPTDGRTFSRLGIQTYGFLPMNLPPDFNFMQTIHAADERIPVEALEFGTNAIYKVLQRYGNT